MSTSLDDVVGVFTADTHIIDTTWASRPSICYDSYYGFQQVVNWAIRCKAPLIVAGDTIELMRPGTPSSKTVDFVREQLDQLGRAGQTLYFIRGQHCMANPHWFSAIDRRAIYVDQQLFKVGDFTFFGLSFREADELKQMIATAPTDIDGWVMHQNWCDLSDSTHGSGQGWLKDIPHGRWVLTGDLHEHKVKKVGSLEVYSPGATHKRTTREPNTHYCLGLTKHGKWVRLPLKSRPVYRLTATSVRQFEELLVDAAPMLQSKTVECVEKLGYMSQVAVPLVLIEDQCRCGAMASAKHAIGDICHLIAVTGAKEEAAAAVPIEASADMMVQEPVKVSKENLYAMAQSALGSVEDAMVRTVIERWLAGASFDQIREDYFAGRI